jgi:hypothetical protein
MCRGELNLNNQASHINIDFQRFSNFTINYAAGSRVKLSKFSLTLSVGDSKKFLDSFNNKIFIKVDMYQFQTPPQFIVSFIVFISIY